MLDPEHVKRFLTAVGDPNRLQILFILHGDKLNVGEIAAQFQKISRPAVSHHLKIMKDAGVLKNEKIGQEVYYWIDKPYLIQELRGFADQLEAFIDDDKI